MTQRTPGQVVANCFLVSQAEGRKLDICHTGLIGPNKPGEQAEADAAFIAIAWNYHDELVAATSELFAVVVDAIMHGMPITQRVANARDMAVSILAKLADQKDG